MKQSLVFLLGGLVGAFLLLLGFAMRPMRPREQPVRVVKEVIEQPVAPYWTLYSPGYSYYPSWAYSYPFWGYPVWGYGGGRYGGGHGWRGHGGSGGRGGHR